MEDVGTQQPTIKDNIKVKRSCTEDAVLQSLLPQYKFVRRPDEAHFCSHEAPETTRQRVPKESSSPVRPHRTVYPRSVPVARSPSSGAAAPRTEEVLQEVFARLRALDIRVEELHLAKNRLQSPGLTVLTEYLWSCALAKTPKQHCTVIGGTFFLGGVQ